ncbi:GtrA family protein [Pseudomonas anuradhapurensis]|uniref:GtrA family protein n=1 Tax=Pseudomonas anuradhapurensis TaxID=485870 RepID=UPI001647CECF|nr:GtrA family protein [Pseudomonas anuradhapurensis]QXI46870.1 GtrA family protein [Pseudomonas anuradhapurensis]
MAAFFKYLLVGVCNTATHAAVFTSMLAFGGDQAVSNLVAFTVALSFSFLANARFTFRVPLSLSRYLWFVAGMGSLSVSLGYLGDRLGWQPMVTVTLFSLLSLVLGFLFSRWVFREKRGWIFR